jgi:pimeloyl-ACP methyl ester carboxylesterase
MAAMEETQDLVHIPAGNAPLEGEVIVPAGAQGMVLFAHGSGSSRHSPRNRFVAAVLHARQMGTLLFDLLTQQEDQTYDLRFDIALLTERLVAATRWVREQPQMKALRLGYFGASTGAASALQAAAEMGNAIGAVVSRGGRPDLAGGALAKVSAPTLLLVGELDQIVLELNRGALKSIPGTKELVTVAGATHLFEEVGALEEVARLAGVWFVHHLGTGSAGQQTG